MTILTYPDERLRQKSEPVQKVDDELREFAKQMYAAMVEAKGVGISAPQVGRHIRAICILVNDQPVYMFNPVILKRSADKITDLEGCLSFPDKFIRIARPSEVHVKYRDMHNKMRYALLSGTSARAVIHETEHLDGKLLNDHDGSNVTLLWDSIAITEPQLQSLKQMK